MYRDDDAARTERSIALIGEIADLDRQKVMHAAADQRLEAARRELLALQARVAPTAPPASPGTVAHLLVFCGAAVVAALGYSLIF